RLLRRWAKGTSRERPEEREVALPGMGVVRVVRERRLLGRRNGRGDGVVHRTTLTAGGAVSRETRRSGERDPSSGGARDRGRPPLAGGRDVRAAGSPRATPVRGRDSARRRVRARPGSPGGVKSGRPLIGSSGGPTGRGDV